MSKSISKKIRGLRGEKRLPYLRDSEPTNPSLMNLYIQALKKDDFETCAVAKALLLERGFKIQYWDDTKNSVKWPGYIQARK